MSLGNFIPLSVPQITDTMTDGWTGINVWRASDRFGTYTKLVGAGLPVTLVAGTTFYSYQDTAGSPSSWYKSSLWNGSSDGTLSEPMPAAGAPVITFRQLIREAADYLGLFARPPRNHTWPGPSGTTTAAGSATTIVCSAYSGTTLPTSSYRGWQALLLGGAYSGEERSVASLTSGSGTLAITPAYTGAPGTGVDFDLYGGGLTGSEWAQETNAALLDIWKAVEVPITGSLSRTEYPIPYYLEDAAGQILGFARRAGSTSNQYAYTGGYDFLLRVGEAGVPTVYLPHAIAANSVYGLETYRNPPPMSADTDTMVIGDQKRRLLTITAALNAADRIERTIGGVVTDNRRWVQRVEKLQKDRATLLNEAPQWSRTRNPRQTAMVAIGGWRWR